MINSKNLQYFFIFILMVCIMFASCINLENPSSSLADIWYRSTDMGNFTLEFKADNTFTKSCDNNAMDPNYWYGTYTLTGNSLQMNINEDFGGTYCQIVYTCTISANRLTMIENGNTIEYVRR